MGCGASDLNPARKGPDRKRKTKAGTRGPSAATAGNRNPLLANDGYSGHGAAADGTSRPASPAVAGAGSAGVGGASTGVGSSPPSPRSLLGKQRYIADNGAVVWGRLEGISAAAAAAASSPPVPPAQQPRSHLIVFTNFEKTNLVFVYSESNGAGPLYVKEFSTDEELGRAKSEANVLLPWPSFFKSIASDVIKGKAIVSGPIASPAAGSNGGLSGGGPNAISASAPLAFRTATFGIVSSKEPNREPERFTVQMDLISRSPTPRQLALFVVQPMTRMAQVAWQRDADKELRIAKAANQSVVAAIAQQQSAAVAGAVRQRLEPLKRRAEEKAAESRRIAQQLSLMEYRLAKRLERRAGGVHPLDRMYSPSISGGGSGAGANGNGGGGGGSGGNSGVGPSIVPFPFHAHFVTPHMPHMPTVNEPLATLLAKSLCGGGTENNNSGSPSTGGASSSNNNQNINKSPAVDPLEHSSASDMANEYGRLQPLSVLLRAPTADPALARIYQIVTPQLANSVMFTLHKLEDWDFDVFELEQKTQGNALFFTSYAILNRLGLAAHFNIDDRVLMNFLRGVQAGYHPNPYHNKTHAADVCQVNYYLSMKAGLIDKCKLAKEDLLASVLAGAIHDYDHPGFNNSLHTRTNAYLSTLYNDRSILENHHLACVFEMMRLPQFDIFKNLTDEQRRTVRETMIEMVLATDMGNHAAIFSSFRRRTAEGQDWHERREDIHLALSMSIKMADVSNCGRPNNLYIEWAKNISAEFYMQGDAEERRGLSISPFMDRKKDKTDFPKGQISFMNYVVVPMFEAIAEFLPPVEVALQCCTENKEYWQHQE